MFDRFPQEDMVINDTLVITHEMDLLMKVVKNLLQTGW